MSPPPRDRVPRACELCRSRKIKCNGEHPCSGCARHPDRCTYRTGQIRKRRTRVAKERGLPPRLPAALLPATVESPITPQDSVSACLDDPEHYKRQQELRAGIGVANPETGNFQFYGPSSGYCFLQRVYQRIKQSSGGESLLARRSCSVPDGLQKWGMDRFMFMPGSDGDLRGGQRPSQAFIPRSLGDMFIEAYFKIMHPQMSVLVHSEIVDEWNQMWEAPVLGRVAKNQEILFMVLAIGARLVNLKGRQPEAQVDGWGEYFASRASEGPIFLQEPSIKGMHLMLLKAMYSLQLMRQNDAYLYLGHATRTAMVLGLHRSQVTDGRDHNAHRLRLTFWTTFVFERISSVVMGRPSAFSDRQIDSVYPDDFLLNKDDPYHQPSVECAFIRSMIDLAKLADRISIEVYSPASIQSVADLAKVNNLCLECDTALKATNRSLPCYLHFFDDTTPIGEDWQEVQRISLGFSYYVIRMLLFRPALVLTTFFRSTAEAQHQAPCGLSLQSCIDESTSAARHLINLAHDVYFRRFPDARYDSALVCSLVSACVTLLYDVLSSGTDHERTRQTFAVVDRGIQCLDEVEHAGYTTGKAMSLDLMKIAKQAVQAADPVVDTSQSLVDSFPWLDNFQWTASSVPNGTAPPTPLEFPQDVDFPGIGTLAGDVAGLMGSEVNYLWLAHGFEPSAIPECLY
ncbi:transcription factor domain-containing protein [Aspergillus candidus]|uniref:Fungal-specific transcription factor domain-domain-containing protein n=1 Tax=Aspergillus candidus TaxID=41067 RepID=A0A2I2FGX6_ASPCN|nr:fungal-specific transcription factor domain-domain-containing protein [Aspergillus candidus]PLB39881.1 fungal-specific transcription factor domain-domain-containing protein [Aspergillus candidus]